MQKKSWGVIETLIVMVVLGGLLSSGFFVLVGDAINKVPGGLCDLYYGITHEKAITPESKLFGIRLVNQETQKLLGVLTVDYPIQCVLSTGGQVLAGEPADQAGGLQWSGSTELEIDLSPTEVATTPVDGGSTTPSETTGRSPACISALAKLLALEGTSDPYPIREAANAVLLSCPEADHLEASAALTVAEKAIVELELAEAQRQDLKNTWLSYQQYASANVLDANQVRQIVEVAGGTYHLESIENLWIGVMKNYVGGGEPTFIVVIPPESISSDEGVSYIRIETTLDTLIAFGIAEAGSGLSPGSVPEFPADYTLGQEQAP